MIRTIIFYIYALIAAVILIPLGWIVSLFPHRKGEGAVPGIVQFLSDTLIPPLLFICGVKVVCTGAESVPKDRSVFFAGNHQGLFDAAVAVRFLGPVMSIIMKKENARIPGASLWLKYFDCIFLDREDARAALEDMKKAQELLENGRNVLVFPEGTRSRGPVMGEFKAGALRCAMRAKVPIVPFVIDGSYQAFEEQKRLRPALINVSVLPAVAPEEYKGMNTTQLSDEIKRRIQAELQKMRGERKC